MEFGEVSKGFGLYGPKQPEPALPSSQVPLWVSFPFGCGLTGGTGSRAAVNKAVPLLCLTVLMQARIDLVLIRGPCPGSGDDSRHPGHYEHPTAEEDTISGAATQVLLKKNVKQHFSGVF